MTCSGFESREGYPAIWRNYRIYSYRRLSKYRTEVIYTTCTDIHRSTKYDKHTIRAHHVTQAVDPKSKDPLCQICAHGARAAVCSFCPIGPTALDTRAERQSQGGLYIPTPYRIFWAFHKFVTRVASFEIFFCRLIGKRFDQTELC